MPITKFGDSETNLRIEELDKEKEQKEAEQDAVSEEREGED